MKQRIINLLNRSFFEFTKEENNNESILIFFTKLTAYFSLFYSFVSGYILENMFGMAECLIYGVFCLFLPVLLKKKYNYKYLVNLFVLGGSINVYYNSYLHGGINSSVIAWTVFIPLMPLFFLGVKDSLMWLILVQISNFALWYFADIKPTYNNETIDPLFNLLVIQGLDILIFLFTYFFYTTRDRIAESLKIKNVELEVTKSNLLESQRHKDVFIANVSHELRNPLGIIIGLTNIVEKNLTHNDSKTYLSKSTEAANHLLSLINDLLDISGIESGKISIYKTNFSLHALIQNTTSFYNSRIADKKISYSCVISDRTPVYIHSDAVRIAQIINNLLDNAIKYTQTGSIHLSCDFENDVMYISIEDTGVGIAEKNIETIFDSFYRVDYSPKVSGTGLGLSIVKQLVNKLEGSITVKSKVGKGSVFYVSIPCEVVDSADNINETGNLQEIYTELEGINILAAEDMMLNQLILENMLTGTIKNYSIDFVGNGNEVLTKLESKKYDIILMDINMPEKNGIETVKEIRKLYGSEYKVIALTANAFKQDIDAAKEMGFDEYVTKPIQTDDLIFKMYRLAKTASPQ